MTTKTTQRSKPQQEEFLEPIAPPEPDPSPEVQPLGWLTIETLLYSVVIVVALALRFWNLGLYPLNNIEAGQALAALALYQGDAPESVAGSYSSLLASLNTLTFLLFHQSDIAARLVMVVLGLGLVLLPVTLRHQLGTKTTFLTTIFLALSPTAIFLSRTLNGELATAVGALMLLSGFFNWARNGYQRWLYMLAGGAAILFTAGPLAYSIVIIFGVVILLRRMAFKDLWQQAIDLTVENGEATAGFHPAFRKAAIFFVVALLLLATTFTVNLSGFGATTGLFSEWLSRFSLTPRTDAGYNAVFLLTIYEPLLVITGFVGLAYAITSKDLLRQQIAGWFAATLVLDIIMTGRPNGTVILAVTPLAFLAAMTLDHLWESLQRGGSWNNEGIILASGLVIATFGYIGLTGWLDRPCVADATFCQLAWLQPVAAIALFAVVVGFFWVMHGARVALRGLALTGLVLGCLFSINITWRLNYGPLRNLAYQPLAGIPASTELIALANTLSTESAVRSGDRTMLDIGLVGQQPAALHWQLRNYQEQRQVGSSLEAPSTTVIITPAGTEEDNDFNLNDSYLGQDFALDAIWAPVGLPPKALVTWLIYREGPNQPEGNKVIVWMRLE